MSAPITPDKLRAVFVSKNKAAVTAALVLWEKITALDLSYVKAKLCSPKYENLTPEQADAAIAAYRRFLFLAGTSRLPLVPTSLIDKAWHHHILHTERYVNDCHSLFGGMLHHNPAAEDASPEQRSEMRAQYQRVATLYQYVFGVAYIAPDPKDDDDLNCGDPRCRSCRENRPEAATGSNAEGASCQSGCECVISPMFVGECNGCGCGLRPDFGDEPLYPAHLLG